MLQNPKKTAILGGCFKGENQRIFFIFPLVFDDFLNQNAVPSKTQAEFITYKSMYFVLLVPTHFEFVFSASAVTSNTLVNEHVRNHVVDLDEDKMPLTSPAHNLLKKRNKLLHQTSDVHTNYSYMNR